MIRSRVLLASILAVPVAAGLAMSPAFAQATGSGATPTMTIAYRVNDIQFDGPDCVQVPFFVDYTLTGVNGFVVLDIAYAGSSSKATGNVIMVASTDGPSGTKTSEITFCPSQYFSNKGPLTVTGTVTSPRPNGVTAAVTPSPITVKQNPVRMSPVRVKRVNGLYTLSGNVVANTPSKGWIGADGKVTIQLRKPGSGRWISGEAAVPDEFGAWTTVTAISSSVYPPGTAFRAVLTDCKWCADATRSGRLR